MDSRLKQMIDSSNSIVFLGGAGVSTESGIPDFRSEGGIYSAINEYGYPPETILSHSFFLRHTKQFFDYYRKNLIYPDARPNAAHLALARLERAGKLTAVITQNIDSLHQAAGSQNVLELHGSIMQNHCMRCGKGYGLDHIINSMGVPFCDCGGIIKPNVVLYEEGLNPNTLANAIHHLRRADMLIVAGTSLSVYPAAGLVDYFGGDKLVLINLSKTHLDNSATLCLHQKVGTALGDWQG